MRLLATLSLFLPFVFAGSKVVLALGKGRMFLVAGRQLSFAQLFASLLICLALIDVVYNALRIYRSAA